MNYKCFLILMLFSRIIFSQDINTDSSSFGTGMVYGKDHAFFVKAPSGWVLDNSSGVSQGIFAIFYPEGGSWEYSPTVMYVNTIHKDSLNETYSEFITDDTSDFRKLS